MFLPRLKPNLSGLDFCTKTLYQKSFLVVLGCFTHEVFLKFQKNNNNIFAYGVFPKKDFSSRYASGCKIL